MMLTTDIPDVDVYSVSNICRVCVYEALALEQAGQGQGRKQVALVAGWGRGEERVSALYFAALKSGWLPPELESNSTDFRGN